MSCRTRGSRAVLDPVMLSGLAAVCGLGSAGSGEAGWGHTRPPPIQPLFREGFWNLSLLQAVPASLLGTSTPGSQPPPGPAPSQRCSGRESSPSPTGSWEGWAVKSAQAARGDPANKYKFVSLELWDSWCPRPLGLLQLPGVPSQLSLSCLSVGKAD